MEQNFYTYFRKNPSSNNRACQKKFLGTRNVLDWKRSGHKHVKRTLNILGKFFNVVLPSQHKLLPITATDNVMICNSQNPCHVA
jgi:hypothetical protein